MCFNSARPESSNLVWPTRLDEIKNLHSEFRSWTCQTLITMLAGESRPRVVREGSTFHGI